MQIEVDVKYTIQIMTAYELLLSISYESKK